ncbi:MAG: export ABC transporter ATP-binding protein [Alicyclobacillus sp. RIFOXYA1_FULL_53_8]|nr:MAG: export ABC transporter ATP-binding protein [Alicyclobacillus sp. RIFOXYA1_FULL_53_8]
MLEVHGLTKSFATNTAVKGVSFQVHPGDAFGLLGPNGAGKSTTISMMTGLLKPDKGEIILNGQSLEKNPRYVKQRIGLVPQSIALYEHLSAEENLHFWGNIYGMTGNQLRENTDWCLDVAGLKDYRKQAVKKYSGGMMRRLNIAVGMIHRPEVLIMDEPTVGIDPQSRNHILQTVRQLNRDGMTVIYTSHYMEEVEYLCTRLAIMDHGQMIAYGALKDVRQLAGALSTVTLEVNGELAAAAAELRQDLTFRQVTVTEQTLLLQVQEAGVAISKAVLVLSRHQLQPQRIDISQPNLESAFLHLTGRQLRDGEEQTS